LISVYPPFLWSAFIKGRLNEWTNEQRVISARQQLHYPRKHLINLLHLYLTTTILAYLKLKNKRRRWQLTPNNSAHPPLPGLLEANILLRTAEPDSPAVKRQSEWRCEKVETSHWDKTFRNFKVWLLSPSKIPRYTTVYLHVYKTMHNAEGRTWAQSRPGGLSTCLNIRYI
jgi:hypothetical protein